MSSTCSRRSLARYATPTGLLLFASADSRFSLEEGILASAPARVIAVESAAHRLVKRLDRDGASQRTCSTLVWRRQRWASISRPRRRSVPDEPRDPLLRRRRYGARLGVAHS